MKNFNWKAIGPGLIWAAAAIGVSHLVQSTRAGADYGFQLVIVVLLANLFKYPFFQYGPRYAIATGESLVQGYGRMGKWVLILFLLLTLLTMFSIQAAVTSVTVGIMTSVLPLRVNYVHVTMLLLLFCAVIIIIGKFKTLDSFVKGVIIILTLSTLVAFFIALFKNHAPVIANHKPFDWNVSNVAFLLALVGWMPSAIDISVWNSLWTIAKIEASGYKPSLKETLLDFNIGYIGTVILSLAFLGLGALVMFNTGETFSNNGTQFANQLFALYTKSIGAWAFPIVAIAAFTTMFSTVLTVLDGYPRVMVPLMVEFFPKLNAYKPKKWASISWMFLIMIGAVVIISFFAQRMKVLVDIATTLSFITAPVLGFLNYKAITGDNVPKEFQPGKFMRILTWAGLVVLTAFVIYYAIMRLGYY